MMDTPLPPRPKSTPLLHKFLGLAALMFAIFLLSRLQPAWAQPSAAPLNQTIAARIRLDRTAYSVQQGQILTVEVWADPASKSYTERVQFMLGFDSTHLTVVDASGNPTTQIVPDLTILNQVVTNSANNGTGVINYDARDTTPCNAENMLPVRYIL